LFQVPDPRHHLFGKTWETIVDLPMIANGRLIGALNLASGSPDAFEDEHLEIAQEFTSQLAVTIQQARLIEEVFQGRERARALSLRLVEVQEEERRALARELHDQIGQLLTSVKLGIELALPRTGEAVQKDLTETKGLVYDLIARVRRLSLNLRPPMLDDLGLIPALDWHIGRYAKQCDIKVDFRHTPVTGRMPEKLETAVFRIVQEALTNIARHAAVKEAVVRVWSGDGLLGVQVEDAGRGFDVERVMAASGSSGLSGMRERAMLLGGTMTVESKPGAGTQLTVEFPLSDGDGAERERGKNL
jgi:signal transduction histidine kinase